MWLVCPVTFIGKDSIFDLLQGPCLGYWRETFLCVFSFMNIYIFLSESILWIFLTKVIIAQIHQMQEFPVYLEDTQLSILPQLSLSHSAVSDSLQSCRVQPTRLLCPWNSPGKTTGVGSNCLLQGTFLIQGSNPGLLHCRQSLYQLSHQGSPILLQGRVKKLIRLVENDKYWVDQKVLSGLSIANFLANSILCP